MPYSYTPDTALRLEHFFKTYPEFRLNLQSHYALEIEKEVKEFSFNPIQP
ncbi:transcriptional regulator [Patescibacteria group bacterium]